MFFSRTTNVDKCRGFSLVELIVYIAISTIVLGAITSFIFVMLESRSMNIAIYEVEQQGLYVMETITQTIRNAESINAPSEGVSDTSLSLEVLANENNPVVIGVTNETFFITEGNGSPINLTNTRVHVTNESFDNLSRTDTLGVVRVQFTLAYDNPGNKDELNYSKTFYTSASLR
jgi:Tfp pilus assembly protein PilW